MDIILTAESKETNIQLLLLAILLAADSSSICLNVVVVVVVYQVGNCLLTAC